MESKYERKIEDIIAQLKKGETKGRKCTLLIGAGCSVTAGIPTAKKFVEDIKETHKLDYERAEKKDYPNCMAELVDGDRRDLIIKYINEATINWAHMCIALLIKHEFVDRVLTVNFDPLVARACALLGEFPAIYDFAASRVFNSDNIPNKAVFHLHGQHTGFVNLHTPEQVENHVTACSPVFTDAGRDRTWIVLGYSGECDPVLKHFENVHTFNRGLYWIGYEQNEPALDVRKGLLSQERGAYYIRGYNADSFFIKLTQELGIFPPKFINHPFTHLKDTFKKLNEYVEPGQSEDILSHTRSKIQKAIEIYEAGDEEKLLAKAQSLLMAGEYEQLISFCNNQNLVKYPQLKEYLSWAHMGLGNDISNEAKSKLKKESNKLYNLAIKQYQSALNLNPNLYLAYYNWGNLILDQAYDMSGNDADKYFKQAEEKYLQAIKINPNSHEAIGNCGVAIFEQAKTKSGEEANNLYKRAEENFHQALKIKPNKKDAFINWGIAIFEQAKSQTEVEAEKLFQRAEKKYQQAQNIKPQDHRTLFDWGASITKLANTKTGKYADKLYLRAEKKYQQALNIEPEDHKVLNNWGTNLSNHARIKSEEEANKLYHRAEEKYQQALKIKPDYHEAFYNLGTSNLDQAKTKTGNEANYYFHRAGEYYQQTLKFKPDHFGALTNWGFALLEQAKNKNGEEADRLFNLAKEKYQQALEIKPNDNQTLNNWGTTFLEQAKNKNGEEADRLFTQAEEKYLQTLKINPNKHEALFNLACLASLKGNATDCRMWLEKRLEKEPLTKVETWADSDFDSVRDLDWFKNLVAKSNKKDD